MELVIKCECGKVLEASWGTDVNPNDSCIEVEPCPDCIAEVERLKKRLARFEEHRKQHPYGECTCEQAGICGWCKRQMALEKQEQLRILAVDLEQETFDAKRCSEPGDHLRSWSDGVFFAIEKIRNLISE